MKLNYLLFLPDDYGKKPRVKWPLIICLHGAGEKGRTKEELEILKSHDPPKIVAESPDFIALTSRFIVLSPQCSGWYWSSKFTALDALFLEITDTYNIDDKRIYLTGLSMGGFGVWQYALRHPHRFAALAPFAGGYRYSVTETQRGYGYAEITLTIDNSLPENLCDLKELPVWVFHGKKDVGIPAKDTSDILVNGLRSCGGNVKYTLFPDKGHDVWSDVYANHELYDWFLENHRNQN